MLAFGPLAFTAPWILAALAALPVIWWLLRVTPPRPREIAFPATRILGTLLQREATPAHTPWWLLLLRLLIGALVILALAGPVLNPTGSLRGSGPVIVVLDDGWAAGADWPARRAAAIGAIDRADREDRPVYVTGTAPLPNAGAAADPQPLAPTRAADARAAVLAMQPKPWPTDHAATLARIRVTEIAGSANAYWFSDGLSSPQSIDLAGRLQELGSLQVVMPNAEQRPMLLLPGPTDPNGLTARVLHAVPSGTPAPTGRHVAALGEDGRLLSRTEIIFPEGETETEVRLDLPVELRNRVARLEIEEARTAGTVLLGDSRWRRRPVGLLSPERLTGGQPLLSPLYYVDRALRPFSALTTGPVDLLVQTPLSMIVLVDSISVTPDQQALLADWVERGGVLLRFAGPRLAQGATAAAEPDTTLLPVRLRGGDRTLGGAMSWSQPVPLADFPENSPFAGLEIPEDVTINRQVLAEPSLDLTDKTWARLRDGTPLVTAAQRGRGWIALVHTTANAEWSDLPLSGLFVTMLRRAADLGAGVTAAGVSDAPLPPARVLDAAGRLGAPPASARPIPAGDLPTLAVGPEAPPGLYGSETARVAVNLPEHLGTDDPRDAVVPLRALPPGVTVAAYGLQAGQDLKRWLLTAALLLFLADLLLGMRLRGLIALPARRATASALLLAVAGLMAAMPATAQERLRQGVSPEDIAILEATLVNRLAFVRTGLSEVDTVSESGLRGLSQILNRRTAIQMADPVAVDAESDELAFYPLLFWAVDPAHPPLSTVAIDNLNGFMRNGGTLIIDTRDHGRASALIPGETIGPGARRLREIARGLRIPPLTPTPPDHVLTRAFYLMQEFPGRYLGGSLWVETPESAQRDGVASLILGSNDFAAAWAVDGRGQPLYPVSPGGEGQRELAYRFGVNLVMYALTGNYKADQVHVPSILERLGQ